MKRTFIVAALVALLAVAIAVPAAALQRGDDPTGARILVLGQSPATHPADEPFHVFHGWGFDPDDGVRWWQLFFRLEIDGERQRLDGVTVEPFVGPDPEETRQVRWLYNSETGLPEGEHTLSGYWYAPCWWAVENVDDLDLSCGRGLWRWRPVLAFQLDHTIEMTATP